MTKRKRVVRNRPTTLGPPPGPRFPIVNKQFLPWICLTLVVLAIVPYSQTALYGFVNFDDGAYVAENPLVQQGLTWSNVGWAWTTMTAGNWHPLTWMSHMLDCQIFGLQPGLHHLINALLHTANTVLVFVVLVWMTGMAWRSGLVAALFAVHPLHVESVAWIAERKDLLSTFFGLLAIWSYVRYTRVRSARQYGLVLCFFALSLLSKPMLVTLPFVFLLLDVWPLQRIWNGGDRNRNPKVEWLLVEKLPLLAMSAASSIITYQAQHAAGAVAPIDALSLSQRLVNAISAYIGYLFKTFWPTNLAIFYPRPEQTSATEIVLAILLLVVITLGTCLLGHRRRWLPVGWFWFLGTLVPVIGLVQVGDQAMADRYAYLPLIGLFIMIAWSLPSVGVAAGNRGQLTAVVVALPVIALTALTFRQVQVWENTETLFSHAINVTKGNFLAHNLLAGAYGQKGDLARTQEHVEKALEIKPNYAGAHYNLGKIMLLKGEFAKAQEQYTIALQTSQHDPIIWNALGVAQVNLARTDEAISNYRHALELNPNFADAYMNLASAFLTQGKYAEAVETSEKALRLNPNAGEAHESLATALWNLHRVDESILHSRKAIELNPNLPGPHINLGAAQLVKGNYDEAIAHLEFALRLNPQNEAAQKLLTSARQKRDEVSAQR